MKSLVLITAGLLGLSAFGVSSAKAGSDEPDYSYRRPIPREYCHGDDEYRPHRVYVRECPPPPPPVVYYRSHYRRRHVGFFVPFLPLPPIPVPRF